MTSDARLPADAAGVLEATEQLRAAAAAKKCWTCGCLRETLDAIARGVPAASLPAALRDAMEEGRRRLLPARYDCLGCAVCHPAIAANALNDAAGSDLVRTGPCATEDAAEREGWPPLPGSYTVLRARAPVAVCTLTDEALAAALVEARPDGVAIVGTLLTENLGIERLVRNVVANPHVRFLVLAGRDSPGTVGHFPGGSLAAFAKNGTDERRRIPDAPGRRPVLRNLARTAEKHFREHVEVVDLVGQSEPTAVLEAAAACAARDPGPAVSADVATVPPTIRGAVPETMTPDPAGWFVVDPDPRRGRLLVEHYSTAGVLDAVIEARTAAEACCTAIEKSLLTRLDHAAYLGRELARAEISLRTGAPYRQDAAPERRATDLSMAAGCGCGPKDCGGGV